MSDRSYQTDSGNAQNIANGSQRALAVTATWMTSSRADQRQHIIQRRLAISAEKPLPDRFGGATSEPPGDCVRREKQSHERPPIIFRAQVCQSMKNAVAHDVGSVSLPTWLPRSYVQRSVQGL